MRRQGTLWIAAALSLIGCGERSAPTPKAVARVEPIARPAPVPAKVVAADRPVPAWKVNPAEATLRPGDGGLQLLAEGPGGLGSGPDRTGRLGWSVEPTGIVAVDAAGYARAIGPGRATVRASVDGRVAEATIVVDGGSTGGRPWDFPEDVVPILTRAGCNAGGCHGRGEGQGGFKLSFMGYDPATDFQTITRAEGGRRLDRVDPGASLLLLKATGRVPHVGGPRLHPDSDGYKTLHAWIAAGAPQVTGSPVGPPTRVDVEPPLAQLDGPGPRQLRVLARYADGRSRDVTRLASFRSLDDSAATVDANGLATLLRRAEVDVIVRYQSHVVAARIATPIDPNLQFNFAAWPRANFIDDELIRRLEAAKVPPSPRSSDAAFLRRVSLDLAGQQPDRERVRRFLDDPDPGKRAKVVDELLKNRDFVRSWQIKLGDMLAITSARFGNGSGRYQSWLAERLASNAPWDAMVRELLTATGDPTSLEGGPVNYALDGPDPKTRAEQTAQRFLGVRLRCAQCHDHPFDLWTQDDYYGLAAVFAKVGRLDGLPAAGQMMARATIKVNPEGAVEHPRTKQPAAPKILGGKAITVGPADDPRKPLAEWMTAPDNPYFARAMANWVWAQFFGRGLADPPDDLSRANPPVHPELLDALARHFVASKFDLHDLIRTIATSEAYGLSSATLPGNARDDRLFSHHSPRPLTAHQMADALAQATDVVNRYADRPTGTRAVDVVDPATPSTILDTFGRCPRTLGCASVATPTLSLRQSLLLIGGDAIEGKVAHLNGYLANLLELAPEPDEIVENLYFRALCRPPTEAELARWSAELRKAEPRREAAEDLFWALLNSREFAFNH